MQMASLQEKEEEEELTIYSDYIVREGANKTIKSFKVISKILTSFKNTL